MSQKNKSLSKTKYKGIQCSFFLTKYYGHFDLEATLIIFIISGFLWLVDKTITTNYLT